MIYTPEKLDELYKNSLAYRKQKQVVVEFFKKYSSQIESAIEDGKQEIEFGTEDCPLGTVAALNEFGYNVIVFGGGIASLYFRKKGCS